MELHCSTHDALYDVKWLERKCKQIYNQWDDSKKIVEEKNIDCNYQDFLRFILGKAETHEHHKRERENVIYIDEEDDCDGENDPQYELFLSRLKEHEKSYVVEGENNGVPVFIKYEAESDSEDEWEQESQRKMMTCVEQIDGLSNFQHGSDMQAQSGNNSSTQSPRLLMNLVKRGNVWGRESEVSTQKPGFRTNGLTQKQHGYDVQALCSRKSNVENWRILKSNRETLVQVHDGLLSQKSGARINWLTEDECDRDDQARPVEKNKVQSRIKSGKVVKGDHGADIETPIQTDEGNLYQKPGRKNNWVTENPCERVVPVQPGEIERVQNQRKSKKVARGTNVVKGDHEVFKKAVVRIDHEPPYRRLGPGNNRLVKNHSEHAGQAPIGDKNKVQNLRKKFKVVDGMNLVKEENEPEKMDVIQIDNADLYQKPGPRNNWVTENPCEHAGQAQPGEKDMMHSQIYLQKLVKGKNVVGEDGGASRKAVIQVDNEHLHQKPPRKNNQLTQYPNEHVDQARPVNKYKERIDRKFKGKNMVKGDHDANKKAMVQIDNEDFHQDPGPRNKWVTRNYCERVDQVQPGNKGVVHGQRELTNVVQGDRGLSNQKTAFGNYAVKNELDHSVKTRSSGEGIHNKFQNVKAAKCSVTYKNSCENNLEKEGDDEIVPEVQILDSAAYLKKGILSPFVPSKRFHKSVCLLLTELQPLCG